MKVKDDFPQCSYQGGVGFTLYWRGLSRVRRSPAILIRDGQKRMFAGSSQLMWVHSQRIWVWADLDSQGLWAGKRAVLAPGNLSSRAATVSDGCTGTASDSATSGGAGQEAAGGWWFASSL